MITIIPMGKIVPFAMVIITRNNAHYAMITIIQEHNVHYLRQYLVK